MHATFDNSFHQIFSWFKSDSRLCFLISDSGEYPIYTEDLDHVEEDNEAKRSGHLLRFARRLNDYEDIFTKVRSI